jgi:RHS repeat-associated protein
MNKHIWARTLGILACGVLWLGTAASAHAACSYGITFDSPTNGASFVAPANIVLRADADGLEDGCTVSTVKFYNGTTLLAQVSRGADGFFSYTWSGVTVGNYTLKAVTGNDAVSTTRTITVNPSQAPSVSLASPTGSPFIAPATIGLSASASDPDGTITKVEFFQGSTLIATDTVAPYQASYSASGAGTYSFTAKATDNAGMTKTTAPTSVTVTTTTVIGNVDDVTLDTAGVYQVRGWACSTGRTQSINVYLYLGGQAGTGTFIGSYLANLASEPAVATACSANGTAYRFSLPLTSALRTQYGNKQIYVHGISPEGQPNNLLSGSGVLSVPAPLALTRRYIYDAHQQLCKSIEPETGTSVMHYDAAGNIDWTASAQNTLNQTDCNDIGNVLTMARVTRSYDVRNRVKTLSFPDGRGNTTYTYHPDGLAASLVADNGDTNVITTTYSYNHRRLLTGERMQWNAIDWPISSYYDANGSLSSQIWHGLTVDYAPNALGQATKAGIYASGVSYYPNGAIKQFTYGNGIVHTLTQNSRGLPDTSRDAYGTTEFLDDGYDYDANGNVAAISDGLPSAHGNRTMTYDDLDRLKTVVSPIYGSTGANYAYDGLDNLIQVNIGGLAIRNHYYCYDAAWHLTNIKTGSCSGPTVIGLGYDPQGNLSSKNGVTYTFDQGNRLRSVSGSPSSAYVYDGQGRRVRDYTSASKYSQYSQSGQLMQTSDARRNIFSEYIYLGGSLVAIRERDTITNVYATKYQHTDALGSPVAVTDASRAVLEHTDYEPFGLPSPPKDGPGYTGHVFDLATGLNYMQQRYYDPGIGRFLSVDPVTADGNTGGNFNRYWYANNNPYRFTDPDGRCVEDACIGEGVAACIAYTPCAAGAALSLAYVAKKLSDIAGMFSETHDTTVESEPSGAGSSFPDRPLPRGENGEPVPDEDANGPHTQLGTKDGRNGKYPQAREFDKDGKPVKDIDFTDHGGREGHPNPHQHPYRDNPTGGTKQRGRAEPLRTEVRAVDTAAKAAGPGGTTSSLNFDP